MWWSDSSGRIELQMTMAQAQTCFHPGQCDADVAALRQVPAIRRQLAKLEPNSLVKCLAEYGAWDDKELSNHDANLSRLVWIAACDIAEGNT
jgi:hypothetical protein